MTKAEYAEYLRSKWWQNRRARALDLAGNRCQNPQCWQGYLRSLSDEELAFEKDEMLPPHAYRLEVHHLTYAHVGNEDDEDLIVLCPVCHAAQHGIAYEEEPFSEPIGLALVKCLTKLVTAV